MTITAAEREYLTEIEIRKYTKKTIRSYKNNLDLFIRYCNQEANIMEIEELSLAVVRQFTSFMISRNKKGTYINSILKTASRTD